MYSRPSPAKDFGHLVELQKLVHVFSSIDLYGDFTDCYSRLLGEECEESYGRLERTSSPGEMEHDARLG
jgi:hypothetical protein